MRIRDYGRRSQDTAPSLAVQSTVAAPLGEATPILSQACD